MTSPPPRNESARREQVRRELIDPVFFPRLKHYIIQATGLHYFSDKEPDLADRLCKRLEMLRLDDCEQYLERLNGPDGKHELDLLVAELTIGETYFFRHTEQFDGLRELIIPEILSRNRETRRLRIWSAGCATGAEPYTVSILLQTHFPEELQGWDVSILGTDINKDFLDIAKNGAYDEWAFRGTPPDLKARCFTQAGKKWVIAPDFKRGVSFQQHNLITGTFPPGGSACFEFDLILCRNVVIYFSSDDFRRIVDRFERCLAECGWLLVGHSEPNTEFFRAFCIVSMPGAILYQKSVEQPLLNAPFVEPVWKATQFDLPEVPLSGAGGQPESGCPGSQLPVETSVPAAIDINAVRQLADRGLWDEAGACCGELLSRDNLNSGTHLLYALILEHLGRHDDSEQSLRRAVYLNRNSVLAHFHLGLRQQKRLEFAAAARSFETVLSLLARVPDDRVYADADGITAAELKHVVLLQKEALTSCEKRSTGAR